MGMQMDGIQKKTTYLYQKSLQQKYILIHKNRYEEVSAYVQADDYADTPDGGKAVVERLYTPSLRGDAEWNGACSTRIGRRGEDWVEEY